jgi:non-ribosomal peptide synthetase component F
LGSVDHRGAVFSIDVGAERTQALRDIAQRLDSTPYSVMFAAYSVLLARMTRRDDVAVSILES